MNRKLSNSPSFTLIELLITTSIVALLAAAAIPSFQTFTRNQTLRRGVEQVRTDLRTAQNRAVSGIDRKKSGDGDYFWWGIDFIYEGDASEYAFVQSDGEDNPSSASPEVKRVKKLPSNLVFDSDICDTTVWFEMITGGVCSDSPQCPLPVGSPVEVKVCLVGNCQSVRVFPGGEIK